MFKKKEHFKFLVILSTFFKFLGTKNLCKAYKLNTYSDFNSGGNVILIFTLYSSMLGTLHVSY